MAATAVIDPKEKYLQDYRKKVQEHRQYETKLKDGKFVIMFLELFSYVLIVL